MTFSVSARARRHALVACFGVSSLLLVATAAAQLPSVAEFLGEPLHAVRGHIPSSTYGSDSHLGLELSMPTSVEVGDLAIERQHFEGHSISLPSIQIAWAHGHSIDDLLGPTTGSVSRGEGYVNTETAGSVTRGDGWVARVWTAEMRVDGEPDAYRHAEVRVLLRLPHDLVCIGQGGNDVANGQGEQVRDWLLERCRSARVIEIP